MIRWSGSGRLHFCVTSVLAVLDLLHKLAHFLLVSQGLGVELTQFTTVDFSFLPLKLLI